MTDMDTCTKYLNIIFADSPGKIIISKPPAGSEFRRIRAVRTDKGFLFEKFTQKQVFHENLTYSESPAKCAGFISEGWSQLDAWGNSAVFTLSVSKKGKILFGKHAAPQSKNILQKNSHNRKKNYIISEDEPFPALVDMGIFTKEGKIAKPMYDKFRQINRFVEIIDDAVKELDISGRTLKVMDFGCGKSYLTFILYHYFTEIMNIKTEMLGLDLKADVIEKCNAAAERYGYKDLHFETGDIGSASMHGKLDIAVTLHACDTATDYALFNAVMRDAGMIFSVPCCQHELNKQMKTENFSTLTRYGIVKERIAALCTDSIRANLLEYCGYKTQLLEFIDFEHTPKNIMIRAVKRKDPAENRKMYLSEAEKLMKESSFEPTFYKLLKDAGKLG